MLRTLTRPLPAGEETSSPPSGCSRSFAGKRCRRLRKMCPDGIRTKLHTRLDVYVYTGATKTSTKYMNIDKYTQAHEQGYKNQRADLPNTPTQPNRAYDVVAKKFRRSPTGEMKGWGLKVFP